MLRAVGQGEEKFDGILDEIAAAAEAEDRRICNKQGNWVGLTSSTRLLIAEVERPFFHDHTHNQDC